MKINKKDLKKLIEGANVKMPIDKKKITDLVKYTYWADKSSQLSDNLESYAKNNRKKYLSCLHESLLCELEKNKYCILSKKEMFILYILVKYHNSVYPKKVYFDKKGLKSEVEIK
jgi:hypothetical protein